MIFEKHPTEKTEISKQIRLHGREELGVHEITECYILGDKMALCWCKK